MANKVTRMTLEDAAKLPVKVDVAKLDATTEEDIRRYQIEDGEDPDADLSNARLVIPAAMVRSKLKLTQQQFADLIRVPVATIRNWEQHRNEPDAAVQTLLLVLWREPEAVRRALEPA